MRGISRYGIYNCLQLEFPFNRNSGNRSSVNASKFSVTMSESGKGAEPVWNDKNKMIRELKDAGIYDVGMNIEDMKAILRVIQDSQISAKGGGNNDVNKTPEQIREDNQPCHSRGFNRNNSGRGSISPDLSGNQMRKSLSQDKRGESGDELIYEPNSRNSFFKENKDVHPSNINKARLSINENFPEAIDNNKSVQRTKSLMRNHLTPKNIISQLDFGINTKDVRLQSLYRTLPEKDCADGGNYVNIDEALPRLKKHLQHTAIMWHSQQGTSVRSKIPWGKAIQVDTDNASQDKESVSDSTDWLIAGPSGTNINVNNDRKRRACARKIIDYTAGEASGNNSDDDFEETLISEKRKTTKRANSSERTILQKDCTENTRKRSNPLKKDDIYVWNEEQMSEIEEEEEEKDEDKTNVKRKKLTEEASSSENKNPTEESVTSESTRRRRNIPEKYENSEWEAIIDDDDDDSDERSKKIGKKKKPTQSRAPPKKITNTRSRRQKSVEPSTSNEADRENDDIPICIEDSEEISIFDSETSTKNLQNTQKNRNEDAVSSTSSSSFPRRIVPPNPKGKYAGIRARKPLLNFCEQTRREKQSEEHEQNTRANRHNRSNSGLSSSEIVHVLETDDEKQDTSVSCDFEIRPSRITDRIKSQLVHLKNLREQADQLEFQRTEERRIKEAMEQRQKEEKIRQRLKEENEKQRREEQIAKAKVEAEIRWNSLLNQQKKRQVERIELNPEGPRRNNDAHSVLMEENHFETNQQNDVELVDDERRGGDQLVPCPICGKKFMCKAIEDHAASCEEYDASTTPDGSRCSSPVVSKRPATSMRRGNSAQLHECHVCSSFSSYDGRKFEDHVNKCVTKHRDGVAVGPSAVVVVPDSPIRNVRKASEQTDSEINYKEQFVPKTKSRMNDNRKRKRL